MVPGKQGKEMTDQKIPLSGIGGRILGVLRDGPPPINSLSELGFGDPSPSTIAAPGDPLPDSTYWQYQDWQPS